MAMPDTRTKFSPLTLLFHWSIALAVIALIALGLYMTSLPRGEFKSWLYGWHKVTGTTVFLVAVARILWRWRNGLPEPAGPYAPWELALARATHYCLLFATLLMPLSGAAVSYGLGYSIPVLGLFEIGPPPAKIVWLSDAASFVHYWAGWALIAIITLHVLGVLKHHLLDGDATLRRMLGQRAG